MKMNRMIISAAISAALGAMACSSALAGDANSGPRVKFDKQGKIGEIISNPYEIAPLTAIIKNGGYVLKDATVVNATRWSLYRALLETGLAIETATGAQTKYNRHRLDITKAHHSDALCVGDRRLAPLQCIAGGR